VNMADFRRGQKLVRFMRRNCDKVVVKNDEMVHESGSPDRTRHGSY